MLVCLYKLATSWRLVHGAPLTPPHPKAAGIGSSPPAPGRKLQMIDDGTY